MQAGATECLYPHEAYILLREEDMNVFLKD